MGYLGLDQKVDLDKAFVEDKGEKKAALDLKWADLGKQLEEERNSFGKADDEHI